MSSAFEETERVVEMEIPKMPIPAICRSRMMFVLARRGLKRALEEFPVGRDNFFAALAGNDLPQDVRVVINSHAFP